jgi:hypothetical protein
MRYNPFTGELEAEYDNEVIPTQNNPLPDKKLFAFDPNTKKEFEINPEDYQIAKTAGYEVETPEQQKDRKLEEQYGTRPLTSLALGTTAGLTANISNLIGAKLGYADAIREIQKRNEPTYIAGEVAGTALPAILSLGESLLGKKAVGTLAGEIAGKETAELAGKEAIETAAKEGVQLELGVGTQAAIETAAKEGVQLELGVGTQAAKTETTLAASEAAAKQTAIEAEQAAINEAGYSRKILDIVEKYSAPTLIDKFSSNTANALVGKGIVNSLTKGAIEGGIYGTAQALNDVVLSEEDLTPDNIAESLLSQAGLGAFIGGLGSAGLYTLGKGVTGIKNKLTSSARQMIESTDDNLLSNAARETMDAYESFKTQKINRDTLVAKLQEAGVAENEIPAFITLQDEKAAAAMLELGKRKTIFGLKEGSRIKSFYDKIEQYVNSMWDRIPDVRLEDAGANLKKAVVGRIDQEMTTVRSFYNDFIDQFKEVPIKDKFLTQAWKEIKTDSVFRTFSEEERKQVKNSLFRLRNTQDISALKTSWRETANKFYSFPENQYQKGRTYYMITNVLDNLQFNNIEHYYHKNYSTKEATKLVKDLTSKKSVADSYYAGINDYFKNVFGIEGLQLKGIDGILDVKSKLTSLSDVDLINKILNLKSGNVKELSIAFKKEFGDVRRAYINAIKKEVKGDFGIDYKKLMTLTKTDGLKGVKMTNETQKLLFGDQAYKKLKLLQNIHNAAPKRFVNWSNTASNLFGVLTAGIAANVEDAVIYKAAYSKMPMVVGSVAKVNDVIESSINKFVSSAQQTGKIANRSAIIIGTSLNHKDYQKRINDLSDMVSNPQKLEDHLAKVTNGFSDDPEIQMALQGKIMAANSFLLEKMPKLNYQDPFNKSTYIPSDQELSKWNRHIRAVDNPFVVLSDMNAGILTPESVESIRYIYPELHSKMIDATIKKLSSTKKSLSMQQKIQVTTLMGVPTSSALSPQFMQFLQKNTEAGQQKPQFSRTMLKSDIAGRTMSGTNKIINR